MSKPILYYHPSSPVVRAVLLVAEEIKLKLDLKLVDLFKRQQLQAEFLKINPIHTVPTLNDNGHIVWDSHAIIPYLVDKYATTDYLYPKDLAVRSTIHQRLHFDTGILFAAGKGIMGKVMHHGLTEYTKEIKEPILASHELLNVLLQENKYIVGDKLTIADFSCATTVLHREIIAPLDRVKYPKIAAWLERMKKLPYFDEINTKNLEVFKKQLNEIMAKNKAAQSG